MFNYSMSEEELSFKDHSAPEGLERVMKESVFSNYNQSVLR